MQILSQMISYACILQSTLPIPRHMSRARDLRTSHAGPAVFEARDPGITMQDIQKAAKWKSLQVNRPRVVLYS